MPTQIVNRAGPGSVALETTLLVHGVPNGQGTSLATELAAVIKKRGANPAVVGILDGSAIVGMNDREVSKLLGASSVPKVNTSNLGVALHRRTHGATTVSATMELAAAAGVKVFATGGIGGVHRQYAEHWDVSADLAALARFPVAVVGSGVKSLLDVESTRETLETLGVPVIGFRTDRFPAFYLSDSDAGVDARFEQAAEIADFVKSELARTGRGMLIANPIPEKDEISRANWYGWLEEAQRRLDVTPVAGRDLTPAILGLLHEISGGATLRANIGLVKSNADLAAQIAAAIKD
jgi:pseudouridine-5'-phosphate glycosidase